MLTNLQIGDRVQLNELGMRTSRTPVRQGVVFKIARSRTQCRVKWDGVRSPQLIHCSLIERVEADAFEAADRVDG